MALRREIQEELEEQEFRESERKIVEKYYTSHDSDMRGIGASILHSKFADEDEPTSEQKRKIELELENNRLKHGR